MSWKLKTAELTQEQFDDRDEMMRPFLRVGFRSEYTGRSVEEISRGDIVRYEGLELDTLRELVEKGYADPMDRQNSAPNIKEFIELMQANPGLTAHGYVVSRQRDDARISIEGVEGPLRPECLHMLSRADEIEYDGETVYCWYD